jgi:hypothetical protein
MPQMPRFRLGEPIQVPNDLDELGRRIRELPESHRKLLTPSFDRVVERIRLEVACLQFDLDATRREKEALQKQLDER